MPVLVREQAAGPGGCKRGNQQTGRAVAGCPWRSWASSGPRGARPGGHRGGMASIGARLGVVVGAFAAGPVDPLPGSTVAHASSVGGGGHPSRWGARRFGRPASRVGAAVFGPCGASGPCYWTGWPIGQPSRSRLPASMRSEDGLASVLREVWAVQGHARPGRVAATDSGAACCNLACWLDMATSTAARCRRFLQHRSPPVSPGGGVSSRNVLVAARKSSS